jgi:serine/threonine protein kinase
MEVHLKEALKIYGEIDDKYNKINNYLKLAELYKNNYKLNGALSNLLIAKELCEKNNFNSIIPVIKKEMGWVWKSLNNYDEAIKISNEALRAYDDYSDCWDAYLLYKNLGYIWLDLKKYNNSLIYFKKVVDLENQYVAVPINEKCETMITMSNLFRLIGNYKEALDYSNKLLLRGIQLDNKFILFHGFLLKGEIYYKLKEYVKAEENYLKAFALAKENNSDQQKEFLYKPLYEFYKIKEDYKKALFYFEEYYRLEKIVETKKKSKESKDLLAKYETQKKENQIKLLTQQNKIRAVTRNFFIACFLLVLIVLVLLFRKYMYFFAFWKKQKYVGEFRLLDKIGSGGMGTVFKAHSIHSKSQMYAIKILRPECMKHADLVRRFKQEGELIDQLDHPHIVKIHERGELKDQLFMVMEYLPGKTLAEKMADYGCYPLNQALHIMRQVTDVVETLHNHGIIHRDLKPENIILIHHDNDPDYVKLLDFGLAKNLFQAKMTMTGMALGTMVYMSREQACGEVITHKADIYSLGVIFYQMLTGHLPFAGEDQTVVLRKILNGSFTPPQDLQPAIPDELNYLILSMLSQDPNQRPDAADIRFILETLGGVGSG